MDWVGFWNRPFAAGVANLDCRPRSSCNGDFRNHPPYSATVHWRGFCAILLANYLPGNIFNVLTVENILSEQIRIMCVCMPSGPGKVTIWMVQVTRRFS